MISFFSLLSSVYLLDILTKTAVRRQLPLGAEINLWPFFSLVHVENTGIAFGLFPGMNAILIIIGAMVTFLAFGLALRLHRANDRFSVLSLALILGGALGNLTDRLVFGRVTDFLDFSIGHHHWPAFNVADSAVCVGVGLFVVRNLFRKGGGK